MVLWWERSPKEAIGGRCRRLSPQEWLLTLLNDIRYSERRARDGAATKRLRGMGGTYEVPAD
jgi:hypothetical protein